MGQSIYRDADWLRERYWQDELTCREMASIADCGYNTIRYWMKKHGIDRRDPGTPWSDKEIAFLEAHYEDMSQTELAKHLDRTPGAIAGKRRRLGLFNGHNDAIDETGNEYCMLTVLGRADSREGYDDAYWLCQCECGEKTSVRGNALRTGRAKSCGCRRWKRLSRGEAALNQLYGNYQRGAKKRGLAWQLCKEEFEYLTQQDCYYCGSEPSQVVSRDELYGDYVYNGIDRINNEAGYVLDNVVSCCGACNIMKQDLDYQSFMEKIGNIAMRHNVVAELPY